MALPAGPSRAQVLQLARFSSSRTPDDPAGQVMQPARSCTILQLCALRSINYILEWLQQQQQLQDTLSLYFHSTGESFKFPGLDIGIADKDTLAIDLVTCPRQPGNAGS